MPRHDRPSALVWYAQSKELPRVAPTAAGISVRYVPSVQASSRSTLADDSASLAAMTDPELLAPTTMKS